MTGYEKSKEEEFLTATANKAKKEGGENKKKLSISLTYAPLR
jgi:hypothetical protein